MNKIKQFIGISLVALLGFTSCDAAKLLLGEPSESEVIYALQKLLDSSALRAVSTLTDVSNNGVEALLPEELQPVLGVLKTTGAIDNIDVVEEKIANVSRDVTLETGEILKDAVKELSFGDAVAVVLGGEDAATQVLKKAMYATAKKRYSSKIETELTKVEPNILEYWSAGSSAYNLFAENKVDSSLSDFLAERSVDVLFGSIGKNEGELRNNYQSIGDQVVTRVFDFYKNNPNGGSGRTIQWN